MAKMKTVYLDQSQCRHFAVPYFEGGEVAVAADALLRSKRDGYDSKTKKMVSAHDEDTLVLVRKEEDAPGWYGISKVIPSYKRPQEVRDAWKLAHGIA